MAGVQIHLDLVPLKPQDIPNPESAQFAAFLDSHFAAGETLVGTMSEWNKPSTKVNGTVQIIDLKNSSALSKTRKDLGIKEYWCGRSSLHTIESVHAAAHPNLQRRGSSFGRGIARRFSSKPANGRPAVEVEATEVERQAAVMSTAPSGLYERFRRGLLEYHSENEREYIEACRETECLQVFQAHVAEVWRLTYVTPPPTNPRTFVVLLLSREVKSGPPGQRCFMNGESEGSIIDAWKSLKRRASLATVRAPGLPGKGPWREFTCERKVEWKMATSSDAGGNIPRFMTNSSLASSISEDVPSFLKWMVRRFPEGGEVESEAVVPQS
ncbi:MAG: hypothetical protein TREMPRED_003790 [Tremellales sp. Tagirdzhanova-0007]|nr:MAG: hypothetical protein TREMPRED_003790 [Tremellales sp. Tagirdzhanova-0007]